MPGLDALTEREKQTLRLLLRGHDAKSAARQLGLSVHTINERLREARRKLAVSSSREAARLLLAHEGAAPDLLVPPSIGEAAGAPSVTATQSRSGLHLVTGAVLVSVFALLALALYPQAAPSPPDAAQVAATEVETSARAWLALLDRSDWASSYAATGASFRRLNTAAVWAAASEKARAPLGAVRSRTLIAHDDVPAPPQGYDMVKFRTDFANKQGVVETVALDKEGGSWRVVGVYLE